MLGAALGAAAQGGARQAHAGDLPGHRQLGSWIEQLVAESTGKEGKGIVPVDLEPVGAPERLRRRSFVRLHALGRRGRRSRTRRVAALERAGQPVVRIAVDRRESLGREIFRWEMATAIAGAALGVNPFDEPNVTEAKLATSALLAGSTSRRGRSRRPAEDTCEVERRRAASAPIWRPARPGRLLGLLPPTSCRRKAATRRCATDARSLPRRDAATRRPSATARASCTRPDSSTRAARPRRLFLQLTADARRICRFRARPTASRRCANAQALGDLQVLAPPGPPRAARAPRRRRGRGAGRARGGAGRAGRRPRTRKSA